MVETKLSLDELSNVMNGNLSSNGWDIVCSYHISQLNAFLKSQYDANRLAKVVSLGPQKIPNPMGDDIEYFRTYELNFASPKISFISGRSGFALVSMPIIDGSSFTTKRVEEGKEEQIKKTMIPGGQLSVQAIVPLAAVNGSTGNVTHNEKIIEFNDGKLEEQHIIIHFKSEKGTTWDIVSTEEDNPVKLELSSYFIPYLRTYFTTEIKEIDYAVSTINNATPASDAKILTPKSFVFTSTGDGEDGVLSLYIQTQESGNPIGNANPSFQPGDQAVSPIPIGYTSSLILSNWLIVKSFLEPQLKNSQYDVTFLNSTNKEAVVAELKQDSSIIVNKGSESSFLFSSSTSGLNVNMRENPLRLIIKDGKASIKFSANTTYKWKSSSSMSVMNSYKGSAEIGLSLEKDVPFSLSGEDVISAAVDVYSSDFNVDVKVNKCDWWDLSCTDSLDTEEASKSLKKSLNTPKIHITLQGINFFNTTNILAPGQNIINFDTKAGIKTPYDFILVGHLVKL